MMFPAERLRDRRGGGMGRGPRPLQIVSPAVSVDVQHLSGGVKAGNFPGLHGPGIEFLRRYPAGRDLCAAHPLRSLHREPPSGDLRRDSPQIVLPEDGDRHVPVRIARRPQNGLPQPFLQQAGQQIRHRAFRQGGPPPQRGEYLLLRPFR